MLVEVYYRFGIGWNFIYSLPTANVSPFMFTIVFVVLFLPKSIKNYFYLLMSLLSLGMIIAGIGGAIWYIGWEDYHLAISVEWFTHFMMALFGIYLVLSKNVDFTLKNSLKSSIIIYCVVALMIILNVIFDTSFFGLAFNGDHNIYTYLVIPNPYLSAFVYILGLTCVLISGYWFLKLVIKIDEKLTSKYE
ncbi:MAG TPA: hypothetical protein PKX91_03565 [Clostridia bacterium]|nr:hypothetical protein [Clostridia bacterium]